MPARGSLARQLTNSITLFLIVLTILFLVVSYVIQKSLMIYSVARDVPNYARVFQMHLQTQPPGMRAKAQQELIDKIILVAPDLNVAVVDRERYPIAQNMNLPPAKQVAADVVVDALAHPKETQQKAVKRGQNLEIARPLMYPGEEEPWGALYVTKSIVDVESTVWLITLFNLTVLFVVWLVVAITIYMVVRKKVVNPILALFLSQYRMMHNEVRPIGCPDPNNELSDLFELTHQRLAQLAEEKEKEEAEQQGASAAGQSRPGGSLSTPPPIEGPEPSLDLE